MPGRRAARTSLPCHTTTASRDRRLRTAAASAGTGALVIQNGTVMSASSRRKAPPAPPTRHAVLRSDACAAAGQLSQTRGSALPGAALPMRMPAPSSISGQTRRQSVQSEAPSNDFSGSCRERSENDT